MTMSVRFRGSRWRAVVNRGDISAEILKGDRQLCPLIEGRRGYFMAKVTEQSNTRSRIQVNPLLVDTIDQEKLWVHYDDEATV